MRTHISRWLDRIAGILLLFVLSFLWFATRLHGVGWAVLLAGLLTALVCWAYVLLVQRISRRKGKTQSEAARRRAAVYRLTMLPEETALSIAGTALCGAFDCFALIRRFAPPSPSGEGFLCTTKKGVSPCNATKSPA